MTESGSNQGRTVARALDLLECLERASEPMRLSDVAHATSLHVATAQRTLNLLAERGYVHRTHRGYTLGAVTLSLAHGFAVHDRLSQVALGVLTELSASTGLTSSVFVRSNRDRIVVARVDGAEPMRYQFPLGQRLPLDIGGGKVVLAALDDAELDSYLDGHDVTALASGESQTRERLHQDLARVRETGYHLASSERTMGVLSLTCAMRRPGDPAPVAGISLVTASEDVTPDSLLGLRPELERASQAIVARL